MTEQAADAAAQIAEPPKPAKAKDLAEVARAQFEAREAKRTARREVEQLHARLQTESQARAAQDRRIAELEALIGRVKGGEALLVTAEQGGDPAKTIETYVAKSGPEQQIDAIRRELEAEKQAREQEKRALQTQEQQRQEQARMHAERVAIVSFTQTVTADAKKYPHMNAEFEPEEIAQKAHEIQQWAKQVEWEDKDGKRYVGASYPFEAVAEVIEKAAKALHDRRTTRRASLLSPSEETSGVGPRDQKRPDASGAQATQRSGSQPSAKPKVTRKLTRDEEEAHDLAMLRTAMAKDAVARGSAKH